MHRLFWAALASGFIVLFAIGIARATRPIAPTGDGAVIENYVIRAGEGRLLVGPYSRFQWHHPGPLYFYLLTPFYAASGHRTSGLAAAALVINLAAIVLSVWIAASGRNARLAAAVAAISALYVFRVGDLLPSTWNPHIIVFPTLALVMACAAAAAGRVWLLPVAALLASFVAQTAVGVLPVAVLMGIITLAAVGRIPSREGASRQAVFAATLLVAAVSWLPAIIEQFTHTPGNFTELWTFFWHRAGPAQPWRDAIAAWGDMLTGPFRPEFYLAHGWVLRRSHASWPRAWAAAQLILLLFAGATSFRARRTFQAWLAALLFTASIVALWSVTRIEGDIMDHEIFWISALGVLNASVIVEAISRIPWPTDERSRLLLAMACSLVIACAASGFWRLDDMRTRSLVPSRETVAIGAVTPAIQEYLLRENAGRPLVKIDQSSWGLAAGVLLELQKAGVPYAVDDDWLPMFTEAARTTGAERVVLSIAGAERHLVLRGDHGVSPVAQRDPVFVDALP